MEKKMRILIDPKKMPLEKWELFMTKLQDVGEFIEGEFVYDDENGEQIKAILDSFLLEDAEN
jgi:hypothetical protein